MSKLAVNPETRQDAVILHLSGPLSFEDVDILKKSFDHAWREKAARVVVDLSSCPYVDSAGIASLVSALNRARGLNRGFLLAGPTRQVQNALELTRLDKVFTIIPTLDAALTAL